jgi:2-isopropylmalate synthase
MEQRTVKILDTTLRDGLRNSGITMRLEQKLLFARQLERLAVDVIEIGYGGPEEVEPMRELAAAVTHPVVLGLSRVNLKDVARVLRGVEPARRPGINIFAPTSDAFLRKSETSRVQALEASAKAVAYARQHLDHVQFSAQDASRSEPGYLVEVLGAVAAAGATVLCITDTLSHALPEEFGGLCDHLRARVPGGDAVTWSVHCHNDLGLGVANCLAAIAHGARQAECTVNGVGERSGNTPLGQLVNALRVRQDAFGPLRTNVSFDQLAATAALLAFDQVIDRSNIF